MKNLDTTSREYIKIIIKEISAYVNELKHQRIINEVYRKKLQQEIYSYIQKRDNIKLIMNSKN